MSKQLLLVEPNRTIADRVSAAIRDLVQVHAYPQFEAGKTLVSNAHLDYVVANLRLGAFNGLHLVHLAATAATPPRCIVYTETRDAALAREVHRAGAFYETAECLPVTLVSYLRGTLPAYDRRDPGRNDRRSLARGGRRCWDQHLLKLSA